MVMIQGPDFKLNRCNTIIEVFEITEFRGSIEVTTNCLWDYFMVTLTCESGLETDFSWTPGGVQGAECTETV